MTLVLKQDLVGVKEQGSARAKAHELEKRTLDGLHVEQGIGIGIPATQEASK